MYTWIPIYTELAEKLLAYRDRQTDLIGLLEELQSRDVKTITLSEPGTDGSRVPLTEIDPFTFFASFNRNIRKEHRIAHLDTIKKRLELTSAVPDDFEGIPLVNNQRAWFFPYSADRKADDIESLWRLAKQVRGGLESIDATLFNRCIDIHQVAVPKLTMGMFWLNPDNFVALDSLMKRFLRQYQIDCDVHDFAGYQILVTSVKEQLGARYPSFVELSRAAFEATQQPSPEKSHTKVVVPKPTNTDTDNNPHISFSAEDCAVFDRYPSGAAWADVPRIDQEAFKSIRKRLKSIANYLASNVAASIPLQAFTSHPTPNGRSPKEIWCCVLPASVTNKSYGLQVALVISQRGAEVCFCRGSGTSQISDSTVKRGLEHDQESMLSRLGGLTAETRQSILKSSTRRWCYRKLWLQAPNQEEFQSLEGWLAYASGPEGKGASVSTYVSPADLGDLGTGISDILSEAVHTFEPVMREVYMVSASPRYWIFQGNPQQFDVDSYLRDRNEIRWAIRQHASAIKPNDRVLIWKSGASGGVVAVCSVVSTPSADAQDDAPELWTTNTENRTVELRSRLRVIDLLVDNPIGRDAVRARLPELSIIKAPQGTNFEVSEAEYREIMSLAHLPTNVEFDSGALFEGLEAIKATHFRIEHELFSRFVISLAAKPFVILTGNSGTGKTKLAQLFAHWLTGDSVEARSGYVVVPVGADWTDNRNIVGFVNHLRRDAEGFPTYQGTPVLDLLLRARAQPSRPFFLVLDEMNLSHVERYFADFLSAMESHKPVPLHAESTQLRTASGYAVENAIVIPDNLIVIGTVNIDETTYMFSPKVLDRANVIELRVSEAEAKAFLSDGSTGTTQVGLADAGLAEAFVQLCRNARATPVPALALSIESESSTSTAIKGRDECKRVLEDIFSLLRIAHAEFAYRTMAEVIRYIYLDFELSADRTKWEWEKCMDAQILQKILPKLHGSKKRVGSLLVALAKYCERGVLDEALLYLQDEGRPEAFRASGNDRFISPQFRLSYDKLCEMVLTVRREQFVTFIQ